ncbi:hypothetical protein ADK58_31595 [Streptomyces sp. XY152]|nr:hypothetical protein ADK58_31595 [Streptomyces sp. XY152]
MRVVLGMCLAGFDGGKAIEGAAYSGGLLSQGAASPCVVKCPQIVALGDSNHECPLAYLGKAERVQEVILRVNRVAPSLEILSQDFEMMCPASLE